MLSEQDEPGGEAAGLPTPLLDTINRPSDLKALSLEQLKALAEEIRQQIIATASTNGGHLAPHLGVVELTLAVHYVYDTEVDPVIWDVGHQSYAHKLVTGRRGQFSTVRKKGGLSGYPSPAESSYDAFGVGHSSTSISAGLGMAVARDRQGGSNRVISIIGDGAMTAGMAFEALSHAGHLGADLLVILNDNKMSISPSVGALSSYFSRLISGGLYNRARGDLASLMTRVLGESVAKAAQRIEHSVKGMITPGTLFEELGFRYIGPVDGHDLEMLVECLSNVKRIRGPVFFHCVTQKGRGYPYAEQDPETYHGVRAFNIQTGKFNGDKTQSVPTFTEAFAQALIEAAQKDPRVVAITAAMPTGTGLSEFEKHFPGRVYDVGICEQHAVTFAAGLAAKGLRPVCAIYSTFLQRAYDQYVHDICMQGLPVVFAIDRAGAVGEDSPTQQGAYDLSFLRSVPGIDVLVPRDADDLSAMLHWALQQSGPIAIRYARDKAPAIGAPGPRDITRGEILREGKDAILLGVGPCLSACIAAADSLDVEGLSIGVADGRWLKPLDTRLLDLIGGTPIITVEENTLEGGFGSAVLEYYERQGTLGRTRIRRLGFSDVYMKHATRAEQLADAGLDAAGIMSAVRAFLQVTDRD